MAGQGGADISPHLASVSVPEVLQVPARCLPGACLPVCLPACFPIVFLGPELVRETLSKTLSKTLFLTKQNGQNLTSKQNPKRTLNKP